MYCFPYQSLGRSLPVGKYHDNSLLITVFSPFDSTTYYLEICGGKFLQMCVIPGSHSWTAYRQKEPVTEQ